MEQVLSRQQAELVGLERRLVLRARDALLQVEGARTDVDRLAKLVDEMDELFLLVIVGEYNSGKSTFINALLGDEVFAMPRYTAVESAGSRAPKVPFSTTPAMARLQMTPNKLHPHGPRSVMSVNGV